MKKVFSVFVIIALLVAGAVLVAGCTQPTTTQNVAIIMPFVVSTEFIPFYTAVNQGYYAEEGLNVTIQHTSEGASGAIKQVVAGNAQFGDMGGDAIIIARSQDIPIVGIYQIDHNDIFGILTMQSSGIKTPQDMVGKSISVPGPGTPSETAAKAILKKSGVDYKKDVTFVSVGGGLLPSLLSNTTDATVTWIVFEEILKAQGVPYNSMKAKDYGANFVAGTIGTTENTIKNNPELVKKFVRATDRGLKYAAANPESAIDGYIKNFNPEAAKTRDFDIICWKRFVNESIDVNGYTPGSFNNSQWILTQNVMYDIGVIDKKTNVSAMYSTAFLPT